MGASRANFAGKRLVLRWFEEIFNETNRSYIAFTRLHTAIWNRTLQVSLLNITKTNKTIRILKILVASSSIFFIQLHVVCLTFEILFTTILHFFNIWGTLLSIIVCFSSQKSQCFCSTNSWERAWTLLISQVFRHYHSWTEPFRKRSSSL